MPKEQTAKTRAAENAQALSALIDHYGGPAKGRGTIANALGVSRQFVATWDAVPAKYARQLATDTGWPLDKILPHPIP